jgi:hypothetical protein
LRMAQALGLSVSPDTLLRRIRSATALVMRTPKVLGVDDSREALWTPTRPDVGKGLDQFQFQEMYVCDITPGWPLPHHYKLPADTNCLPIVTGKIS